MYASEARDMVWNAHAKALNERRLIDYNSVAFLVPVSKSLSSANTKGDLGQNLRCPNRSSSNPCSFQSMLILGFPIQPAPLRLCAGKPWQQ